MRSSGWILVALATCLWIAVGVLPLASGFMSFNHPEATNVPMIRPLGELLLTTAAWSVAVAGGALIVSWWTLRVRIPTVVRWSTTVAAK